MVKDVQIFLKNTILQTEVIPYYSTRSSQIKYLHGIPWRIKTLALCLETLPENNDASY